MTWTKQIKSVLKADPDAALKVRKQATGCVAGRQLDWLAG
jgi:hypothetical protein